MKTFCLLFIFLSSQLFAQYTTPNTGVNWNLNDLVTNSGGVVAGTFPNYAINNKITVSETDRIYILPGSVVVFSGSQSGFEIFGKFLAIGTPTDSIFFSAAVEDSLGNSFNGFYFRDTSVDSACIISYARIEYAYYGLRCLGASPTLSHSYLWKCRRGANLSSDSHPAIVNNRIERSYEYGITMTTGCSPLIEYNELINNNSQNTSPKNQISIGTQGNNSPTIRHNKIEGGMFHRTGGISISTLFGGSSSTSEIAYNEIFNNSFGIALQGSNPITAYIHSNLIYNNNINPDVMAAGSGINAYGTAVVAPVIAGNTIYGNWWGITIQIGIAGQPGPQVNLGNIENADTTDDGMNIIFGNIQGSDVYDLYNNTLETVYAQNNDWGVYDSSSIEDHIFHFVDDSTLGLVIFTPFSGPIPVELASFTANVSGNSVTLNWVTASEVNNMGFEIEKRLGNRPSAVGNLSGGGAGWEKLGFVSGKGTTTDRQSYSYTDEALSPGQYSYRLKQTDFDGTFEYSNEVEVTISLPVNYALHQNYPNPFNPSTKISWQAPVGGHQTIKVFDVLGNEIATLVDDYKPAGIYEVEFVASSFSSGVYFYQLKAGDFIQTRKMTILK
ncbi:MAG: right-handed parallel beta-helix repeat-containing protein [Ignavibacteriaceae bacterium]